MATVAMQQMTIDFLKDEPKTHIEEVEKSIDDYALVYLVTMHGGAKGNLWVLKKEDAMKLCEDDCSSGTARRGKWMFNWTSLSHFKADDAAADQHKNVHGKLEPFVFMIDTGKQDADFERLGIEKPGIYETAQLLRELGYEFTYRGKMAKNSPKKVLK